MLSGEEASYFFFAAFFLAAFFVAFLADFFAPPDFLAAFFLATFRPPIKGFLAVRFRHPGVARSSESHLPTS